MCFPNPYLQMTCFALLLTLRGNCGWGQEKGWCVLIRKAINFQCLMNLMGCPQPLPIVIVVTDRKQDCFILVRRQDWSSLTHQKSVRTLPHLLLPSRIWSCSMFRAIPSCIDRTKSCSRTIKILLLFGLQRWTISTRMPLFMPINCLNCSQTGIIRTDVKQAIQIFDLARTR